MTTVIASAENKSNSKSNNKTHHFMMLLSPSENAHLSQIAEHYQMSKASYCRFALASLKDKTTAPPVNVAPSVDPFWASFK